VRFGQDAIEKRGLAGAEKPVRTVTGIFEEESGAGIEDWISVRTDI